ncbi:MAG: hypothetical protein N4A47_07075 [Clostridia bacterium]|jgi:hypothetical protein|nr:hypothetical protein [Clostridia bacterium]
MLKRLQPVCQKANNLFGLRGSDDLPRSVECNKEKCDEGRVCFEEFQRIGYMEQNNSLSIGLKYMTNFEEGTPISEYVEKAEAISADNYSCLAEENPNMLPVLLEVGFAVENSVENGLKPEEAAIGKILSLVSNYEADNIHTPEFGKALVESYMNL